MMMMKMVREDENDCDSNDEDKQFVSTKNLHLQKIYS